MKMKVSGSMTESFCQLKQMQQTSVDTSLFLLSCLKQPLKFSMCVLTVSGCVTYYDYVTETVYGIAVVFINLV